MPSPIDPHPDPSPLRHPGGDAVLPLPVRQRLWDQLWTRLLAPPTEPADRQPAPRPDRTEGKDQ
jgi:hypothetical protein